MLGVRGSDDTRPSFVCRRCVASEVERVAMESHIRFMFITLINYSLK